MTQRAFIEPEPVDVLNMDPAVWHSEPMRIGQHDWIIVLFDHEYYGLCSEYCFRGPRAPDHVRPGCYVPADRYWPTYDNGDENGGMPATLRTLYARHKQAMADFRAAWEGGQQ